MFFSHLKGAGKKHFTDKRLMSVRNTPNHFVCLTTCGNAKERERESIERENYVMKARSRMKKKESRE